MRTHWNPGRIAAAVALAGAALAFSTNAGAVGSATVPKACVKAIATYHTALATALHDLSYAERDSITQLVTEALNVPRAPPCTACIDHTSGPTPTAAFTIRAAASALAEHIWPDYGFPLTIQEELAETLAARCDPAVFKFKA